MSLASSRNKNKTSREMSVLMLSMWILILLKMVIVGEEKKDKCVFNFSTDCQGSDQKINK